MNVGINLLFLAEVFEVVLESCQVCLHLVLSSFQRPQLHLNLIRLSLQDLVTSLPGLQLKAQILHFLEASLKRLHQRPILGLWGWAQQIQEA